MKNIFKAFLTIVFLGCTMTLGFAQTGREEHPINQPAPADTANRMMDDQMMQKCMTMQENMMKNMTAMQKQMPGMCKMSKEKTCRSSSTMMQNMMLTMLMQNQMMLMNLMTEMMKHHDMMMSPGGMGKPGIMPGMQGMPQKSR